MHSHKTMTVQMAEDIQVNFWLYKIGQFFEGHWWVITMNYVFTPAHKSLQIIKHRPIVNCLRTYSIILFLNLLGKCYRCKLYSFYISVFFVRVVFSIWPPFLSINAMKTNPTYAVHGLQINTLRRVKNSLLLLDGVNNICDRHLFYGFCVLQGALTILILARS